jgi:hypothetical protein
LVALSAANLAVRFALEIPALGIDDAAQSAARGGAAAVGRGAGVSVDPDDFRNSDGVPARSSPRVVEIVRCSHFH